ncbi:MAG: D-alanine--D-alanine ligase [Chloroflexota bacterium]|nr:D-alanine--D-alanine ligase [Chloroflexota bacterium]
MTEKMRLGVVFGGETAEHEVSVVSALELLAAADPSRFESAPFGVTRDGRWLTPDETRAQLRRDEPLFHKRIEADVPPLSERGEVLRELSRMDVVFPLVHGVNGEDGTLQGMLEMFGLPYAGCGVAASAIGMDKGLQKDLFRQAGLGVARSTTVFAGAWEQWTPAHLKRVEEAIGYPCFVKPANGGSSVGVSRVRSREDVDDALRSAFSFGEKVLIEELISGREVECGILGNRAPEASPVGEVVTSSEFYDYTAKYLDESAQIIVPAEVPAATATALRAAAVTAYEAIDAAGFARVDFFLTEEDRLVINEINTLPGFRPVSMFPRLWAAAGVTYRELISRIVDLALERFRERRHPHG